uniref:Cytosolic fatty-acid binding proteins domain-containing protein n=1 Tax=Aureoumbra lagunensis TaxID=44058 RepID=A0A6S8B946_9STRA|mmetsp:Transcript_3881/g.5423  ORF Transcript_3881/g.5423 Transcript_3881/m.5423 type:complete len:258 (-) Transcript_3881:2004-2777(-)|eukprot:CAMPEP_0197289252 /NCGR_PEP_ID=MMETSP0890-20130614/6489_1 /TAXON_ID=44058 ORGANISM="Aureoumbra lagunensis, Strain CCMP1510" /NCGR_SAMPLE_ID=MMETSP0890 /ASSEMBLY_ACC=CAM_ASM_000533 /LENGTH=257 /DNA_ID=CAMNT_0042760539 /DNA_START=33 /DNA_END=806 /DNA_ORIENTATION=+
MTATLHSIHHGFMACALAACAVVGLKPPSGGGLGNRWSRGKDDPDRFPITPFVVLLPATLAGIPFAILKRQQQQRSQVSNSLPVDMYGTDFSGHWRLERSENFDEYLTSMNVSATHRSFATRATVEQRITRNTDGDLAAFEICVLNRLGVKCESFTVGKKPLESSDARGDPIVKHIDWEDKAKRILRTRVDSSVGTLVDKRFLETPDKMVMELISPTDVRAYRHFTRINKPSGVDNSFQHSTTALAAVAGSHAPVAR